MPEWLNGPVSKTGIRASVSWVRIPPSPPVKSRKALKHRFPSEGLVLDPYSYPCSGKLCLCLTGLPRAHLREVHSVAASDKALNVTET